MPRLRLARRSVVEPLETRHLLSLALDWAAAFPGADQNSVSSANATVTDAAGNVYVAGQFRGTVDFDPGSGTSNVTSQGDFDAFFAKLDSQGNLLWVRTFGGAGSEFANDLAVDAQGNVYAAGVFNSSAAFTDGQGALQPNTTGEFDIFVGKLDGDGNVLWNRGAGGPEEDQPFGIAVDDQANVYVAGTFMGTADFDPGAGALCLTSAGGRDGFVWKLDTSGNPVWARSFSSAADLWNFDLAVDSAANVYVTGAFFGSADFDPSAGINSLTSAGGLDVHVTKLDQAGDFVWAQRLGGAGIDEGHAIEVAPDGLVFIAGSLTPDTGDANALPDIMAAGLGADGNVRWIDTAGNPDTFDEARDLALDRSGNLYVTGGFAGTIDFNPRRGIYRQTSAGSQDVFIWRLNRNGRFVSAQQLGGSGFDEGRSIFADSSDNIHLAGSFEGSVDFDPGSGQYLLTTESLAAFSARLQQSPPADQLRSLRQQVRALVQSSTLPLRLQQPLIASLNAALRQDRAGNDIAAANQLRAFVTKATVQAGRFEARGNIEAAGALRTLADQARSLAANLT